MTPACLSGATTSVGCVGGRRSTASPRPMTWILCSSLSMRIRAMFMNSPIPFVVDGGNVLRNFGYSAQGVNGVPHHLPRSPPRHRHLSQCHPFPHLVLPRCRVVWGVPEIGSQRDLAGNCHVSQRPCALLRPLTFPSRRDRARHGPRSYVALGGHLGRFFVLDWEVIFVLIFFNFSLVFCFASVR